MTETITEIEKPIANVVVDIPTPKESRVKLFCLKMVAVLGSFIVMGMVISLSAVLHVYKFFRKRKFKDVFHNSRQHPLNSPEAPRG